MGYVPLGVEYSYSSFFLLFIPFIKPTRYRVIVDEYGCNSHTGFVRAPYTTYVPDLATTTKWLGGYGPNAWCIVLVNNWDSMHIYHNSSALHNHLKLPEGKKSKAGDRFGFELNLKNKTWEVFHNGVNMGVVLKDLPSEISPAMSNGTSKAAKGSIRFVSGKRKA